MNTRALAKKIFTKYPYVYESMNLKVEWQKPDPEVEYIECGYAEGEEEKAIGIIESWIQEATIENIEEEDEIIEFVANSIIFNY